MRMEKVIRFYPSSIRADLDILGYVITIDRPNEPTVVIPDFESIRGFIEGDEIVNNALNSNISAEKIVLYYSENTILAEAIPRGDRVNVKFTCGGVLIMDGIMAYLNIDSFNKVLEPVMKYFDKNKELYLKRATEEANQG